MKQKDVIHERAPGGSGLADALFRKNASSREYSRSIGKRQIHTMGLSGVLEIHDTKRFFLIALNGRPMLMKDYSFVEAKRKERGDAFEEWLEKRILELLEEGV